MGIRNFVSKPFKKLKNRLAKGIWKRKRGPGGDTHREGGKTDVGESEAGQNSHLRPETEGVAESGPSREENDGEGGKAVQANPPVSTPSISRSDGGEPNVDIVTSAVSDPVQVNLHPNKIGPNTTDGNKSNWKSTASATTKLFLRGVRDSADAFGPLKSVAGGLYFILENCDRTKANEQAIESLAPRVEALSASLCTSVSEGDSKEQERRKKLERELENILGELEPLAEQGKVEGFLNNIKNADKLAGLVEDIRDAVMEYQTALQQDIYDKSCQLIGDTERMLLNVMNHTDEAGHRSGNRQGCLKGTRKEVLLQLENWSMDEQDQRVFWLNGLAGTGKSTIAQTFAEMSFADGRLGATFFCSRDFEDRSNLQMIFPTLAFQLAYRYPLFRQELLRVLRANPGIGRESLCSQMERLIVGPFKAIHISALIIIDALDECKDEEPASAILSVLSRYVEQIPHVKFFITGRPEPRIRSGFRLAALRPITEVLKLHDVKRPLVDVDIKLFLRMRLADIARNWSHCDVTEDWPLSSDIDILCKKAAGLFIYASTVVKFVSSRHHQPLKRLSLLVSLPQNTSREGESGINSLYTEILRQAYSDLGPDDQNPDNQEVYRRFRFVVGAVLLAFNPLSMRSLSHLLHDFDTPFDISTTLNPLHSLLLVPEGTEDSIRVFHKSFPDFLMDLRRCQDMRFFVDPSVHHTNILFSCLHLMEERLKKNICDLDDYADLNNASNLLTRKKCIGEALEYACQFWTKHLVKSPSSGPDAEEVQKAVDKFFAKYLLFWIEVLIIVGNLDVSVHSINDIQQWYTLGGSVCKWASDSQCLILGYFDTIHKSLSQLYHFALPFSPSSSWLHKYYAVELSQAPKVIRGAEAEWGTCSRTVSLGSYTPALSYWNNTITVGSKDGSIIILNAITGSQIAILSEHTDQVNCFTFSLDGKSLVSGSNDKTVKLWDVQTGGVVKTFYGHTDCIWSVCILRDCTRIASGSEDKTICLWDIQTGECFCAIKQEVTVRYVGLSPTDPQHIISTSNGKVWEWDVNGHQIPPTYDGTHIAFSPDNIQFALCNGRIITVQDSNSRAMVAEFHVANNDIRYCCFSPDGRLVAAAAGRTAYVWDITNPDPYLINTFAGHTGDITSLVFSSPSSLISASWDSSIKFWQIYTLSTDPATTDPGPTLSTLPSISSVSIQAKAGIAISTDEEGVVKTWDISTGLCQASFQTPVKGYWRDVQLIDDRLTIAWYQSQKIHIWNVNKGESLQIVDLAPGEPQGLRISGDGSKVFCLTRELIQAWSTHTGKLVGEVKLELEWGWYLDPLQMDGSIIWIRLKDSSIQGWDFGISGSPPTQSSDVSARRPLLDFIGGASWQTKDPCWIKDTATGKELFQLSGRYAEPKEVQWDGWYLVAGYGSGEVLILDFHQMYPQ